MRKLIYVMVSAVFVTNGLQASLVGERVEKKSGVQVKDVYTEKRGAIEVLSTDDLAMVKEKIAAVLGTPPEKQELNTYSNESSDMLPLTDVFAVFKRLFHYEEIDIFGTGHPCSVPTAGCDRYILVRDLRNGSELTAFERSEKLTGVEKHLDHLRRMEDTYIIQLEEARQSSNDWNVRSLAMKLEGIRQDRVALLKYQYGLSRR